jgi:hypothetical protein
VRPGLATPAARTKTWRISPGGALDRIAVQRYLSVNVELAKALIAGTTGDENH